MRMLFVAALLATSSPALAQESNPLIGTWRLVSFQTIVENSEPQNNLGARPKGYIILTREGRMITVGTGENRKAGTSDTEQLALYRSLFAYSGRYRVEGGDFITTVDVSWNETWNGTEQRRHFRIEGDKLLIETVPGPSALFPGKTSFGRTVFERER